jgi:hypothetical protein
MPLIDKLQDDLVFLFHAESRNIFGPFIALPERTQLLYGGRFYVVGLILFEDCH